jgi:hypothetical protein
MREQPFDPFEQGKILQFDGEIIPEKSILNSEAYAALVFNLLAQEFQRNIFGRHGNPAALYVHSRGVCSVFLRSGLNLYPGSRQAPQTEKDEEKQEPWTSGLKQGIHDTSLA